MPATAFHVFTSPVADGTNTQLVRPSNWNESHALTISPSGQEMIGGFSNANNVTFATETNGKITASASFPTQTAYVFSNSNGISFGTNGSTVTATVRTDYQPAGAYLTTARASNDAIGLNTALTGNGVVWTVNSAGISLNVPAFLTTAAQSNHSHGNPTLALTNLSGTTASNSNGLTLSLSAAAGGGGADGFNILAAGTQTAGTNVTVNFANSNGITFGMSGSSQITASHNGLTTAAQSNHSHGNPTLALTNISGTTASASNGVTFSLSAGAIPSVTQYFSATNTTFNGTNVSGSITLNTNGLRIDLSAPAPGGGGAINVSAGTTSGNLQTIQFNNANGVTFGLNGSTVTASVNAGGGAAATQSKYAPYADINGVIGQIGNGTIIFDPDWMPNIHMDRVCFPVNYTATSNSSGSFTVSMLLGLYTQNASTLSLMHSTSVTLGITNSGTVGSYSLFSGLRHISAPWSTTITEGQYFIAMGSRTTTGGAAGMSMSNFLISNINTHFVGFMGASHNTTMQYLLGQGVYSATSSALPGSVAFSQIRGSDSAAFRAPKVLFQLGTA